MSVSEPRPTRRTLLILAAGLAVMLVFALLSRVVLALDAVDDLDVEIAQVAYDTGETSLDEAARALTMLGNEVLYLLGFGVGLLFIVNRQWSHLLTWALAVGAGKIVNILLKEWIARPRPTFSDWINPESSLSYPSGHAMMAMLAYGMLAVFIWHAARNAPSSASRRSLASALIIVLSAAIIVLVALTRIVLHVHYLSDVLGGLIAGALWLVVCAALFFALVPRADQPSGLV